MLKKDKISLIITAGGTSSRYGKTNKLLEKINDKTIIEYSVDKFKDIDEIFEIVISANKEIIPVIKKIFEKYKTMRIIEGGKTRQQSVFNALKTLNNPDYVLIHDGARPLVDSNDIKKLVEKIKIDDAATLAVKTIDTIKKADETGKIISTIDRTDLYNIQTPQGFKYDLIYSAHKKLNGSSYTDDAGMIEAINLPVYIVEGNYKNFKITTKDDFERMKYIVKNS